MTMTPTIASVALMLLFVGLAPAAAQGQTPPPAAATTTAPYFAEQSMNVFRRFSGDGVKTLEFYGQVLGFGDVGAVVETVVAAAAGSEEGRDQGQREQLAFVHSVSVRSGGKLQRL